MNNSIIITPNNAPVSGALFIKNQIKSSLNGGIIILLLLFCPRLREQGGSGAPAGRHAGRQGEGQGRSP